MGFRLPSPGGGGSPLHSLGWLVCAFLRHFIANFGDRRSRRVETFVVVYFGTYIAIAEGADVVDEGAGV